MRLRYETGIATLVQFVVLTILNVGTGLISIISGCRHGIGDCIVNSFTSVAFFVLLAVWFGIVWLLGFFAQDRRSRKLAQLLIMAEVGIGFVALFNARHHTDAFGLFTSLVDVCISIWVIVLAIRLMNSKGNRIVKHVRVKNRPMS